jgi:multidrug resistance efflux pump
MFTKYVLPIVAVLGVTFAVYTVVLARQPQPPSFPVVEPPVRPAKVKSIAGAGIVEARKENIPVGSPTPGVVWEVFVKVGDYVRKGDPLFKLDDRELQSELKVREAMLVASQAQLHKLEAAPRAEDIPPAQAALEEARAKVADTEVAMARTEKLFQKQMAAAGDYDKDRFAYYSARAAMAKAAAELARIKAGSWKEDIEVAKAAVLQAESQVESIQIMLDRLTVRALADGEVLQVNVRPGQFAALAWREPMIILGDVNRLHVRVDIDENDVPYFEQGARAIATLKGRPHVQFPLDFVKIEPYVTPKKSLTGDNSERVDTRVLQAIYALPDNRPVHVYVGQQMDVYIKAAEVPHGISLDADPKARLPFEDEEASSAKAKTPAHNLDNKSGT